MNYRKLLIHGGIISVFCLCATAVMAGEIQLLGIRLGSPAIKILKAYGNPTEMRVGGAAAAAGGGVRAAAGPAAGLGRGVPSLDREDRAGRQAANPVSAATPAAGNTAAAASTPAGAAVTYVYRFSNNRSAEFYLNPDGICTQIAIYGAVWPGQKTNTGIALGTVYKDIIAKCGYPETHIQQGIQMTLRYVKSDRVVYTLVGNTVVGINIALQ